ncbi:hypothetical protein RRF57_004534 [Xylaria bambusicola]|uniref:Uncharacterized protein n=1 Tax=Xylaria bambusicola TaxID=326684 RepID=A0AAN7UWG4_9PEZI
MPLQSLVVRSCPQKCVDTGQGAFFRGTNGMMQCGPPNEIDLFNFGSGIDQSTDSRHIALPGGVHQRCAASPALRIQ